MKRNISLLSLLCATSLLISAPSFAADQQKGHPGPPPSFDQLDANGDGVLSKDEVQGPLVDEFDHFDENGDGVLSKNELPAPPKD
ncbi:hypothetical protein ACXJY6_11100 [Vibrio sp. RC27]